MMLTGARIARNAASTENLDLHISRYRIQKEGRSGPHLNRSGHLIVPGLIDSHDHLEFNLFPRLVRGVFDCRRRTA
jgi:cytosine/adenosine deaminase-related metal-dependent hydrolase